MANEWQECTGLFTNAIIGMYTSFEEILSYFNLVNLDLLTSTNVSILL